MLNTSNNPQLKEELIRSNIPKDIPDLSKKNKIMLFIAISLVLLLAFALLLYIFSQRNGQPQQQSIKSNESSPTQSNISNLRHNIRSYTNNLAGFSFEYPDNLGIQWAGAAEDPSDSSLIYVSPIENMGFEGMAVQIVTSMKSTSFASERDLIREGILDYHATSTANYLYPENNRIVEKIADDESYVFEIEWLNKAKNSEEEADKSGTNVIHIYAIDTPTYPITPENAIKSRFLWIEYSIEKSDLYAPIVNSIKLNKPTNMMTVKMYYHDKLLDPNTDTCEANNFTEVKIPYSSTPIKDTIKALISTDYIEKDERFYLKEIYLKDDGSLVLEFPWVGGFTTGGSCRIGILTSQIENTALQFPEVKRVVFDPEVFQP